MAKKIRISGQIGWDITSSEILSAIDDANGDDLEVEIASVGGSVFQGTEISNALRGYKRENPDAQILITITGTAASMASYIAAVDVADLVAAYDNVTAMYHNPSNFAVGDYREMQKNARFLEGLTGLMRKAYAKRSGKSIDEIAKMLDNETWLYGEELKEQGFVDEIIETDDESDEPQDRETEIAAAKLAFSEMVADAKKRSFKDQPERVAAVMREVSASHPGIPDNSKTESNTGVTGSTNKDPAPTGKGETLVNLEELKTKHPELYAEAVAVGAKQGEEKERQRVADLTAMKNEKAYQGISAVQETLEDCIAQGKTKAEALPLVIASFTKNTAQAEAENPGDIDTGGTDTATGEGEKAEPRAVVTEV